MLLEPKEARACREIVSLRRPVYYVIFVGAAGVSSRNLTF